MKKLRSHVGVVMHNAHGQTGVCDSRCWLATDHDRCTCVCGGKFHGHGVEFAMSHLVKLAESSKDAALHIEGQLPLL